MSDFLNRLYRNSPGFIQNIMVTGYGLKIYRREYGPKFKKSLSEFEARQWLTREQVIEYQNRKLSALIKHAYENIPYYRKIMDSRKLKPSDITRVEDLNKLPIITREDVRANKEEMVAGNYKPAQLIKGFTSGTTGSPLELIWDNEICHVKTVVDWRQKKIAGIAPGDRMAFFLGRTMVPLSRKTPPFWRHNLILNHLFCSSWHLSSKTLPLYFEKLSKFKPVAIEGYPSTMYILAKYLVENNRTFPLKAAFTSSETLMPHHRETIEKAFGCKLFDFYGMAERVAFATECELHDGKHINMDFSILETVTNDGEPAAAGQMGRIVATGFHNFAMPLIRYKTSDVTILRGKPCSCGRGFELMENITTKDEDIVSTKDGRYISSSIINAVTHHMTSISEHQVIQDDLEHIKMLIVKKPDFKDSDRDFLVSNLKDIMGDGMEVTVEYVDSIPRTSGGKFRWVISKVPLKIR
jgi:phenylacetate-CoA ligase